MIGLLTAFFGLATLAIIGAVLFHFRRKPIVWLIAHHEREHDYHRNAAAALTAAIAAERAAGNEVPIARLEAALASHRRSVATIDAAREFAGQRR